MRKVRKGKYVNFDYLLGPGVDGGGSPTAGEARGGKKGEQEAHGGLSVLDGSLECLFGDLGPIRSPHSSATGKVPSDHHATVFLLSSGCMH